MRLPVDDSRCCMSYWWPRLQLSGVPVPETILITTDAPLQELYAAPDPTADATGILQLIAAIASAGEYFGYPCFLRTGLFSGKHQWRDTCYLTDEAAIPAHIGALVEASECADLFGLPTNVWAVRELLPVQPAFYAFRGLPITRERRYFVSGRQVVKHRPYWPEDAFSTQWAIDYRLLLKQCPDPPPASPADEYLPLLREVNQETPHEIRHLTRLSEQVGRQFEGTWSVDWLWTERGWYCIDMAPAERSWGWAEEEPEP